MKQTLFFLFLLYSVGFSQVYMNINNKDGTTPKIPIDDIRKLTFSNVVSVEDSKLISETLKSFTLLQNYPNPFNPTTTIKYEIGEISFVTLKVYNSIGQEVETLVNKQQLPGSYNVEFNASYLPSGIYYYKIESGQFLGIKKLVLVK